MSADNGLYKDLTYKIIGLLYSIHNELGYVHKENIYHNAISIELKERNINFEEEKSLPVKYKNKTIGVYKPDFIIEGKVILEIKSVPVITKEMMDQVYYYIKGTKYKLVLLANFGTKRLTIKRRIYS
ncbi:MAG: GxxExxY protein [Candidatus Omnitrophota bacterium]|nr:GxxExxY protein [Candidatus Omnitrophota bacterium]